MLATSRVRIFNTALFFLETSLHINSSRQTSDKIPIGELSSVLKTKMSRPGTREKEFKVYN